MIKKAIPFFIYSTITLSLAFLLNSKTGILPPLAKFFDPFRGFWQNAESPTPELPKRIDIAGIKDSMKVLYDSRLVPHVFAKNEFDLYFMQGYITAQHRLWQMDMQSRAASGRLAEIAGAKALASDMQSRRTGLHIAARKSEKAMMQHPKSRLIISAYSAGVNALINSLDEKNLPLEYKMLDFKPEAWSPYKTALLLKYMANILTANENDFENTNFLSLYGTERFNQFFPDFPDTLLDPVIPYGTTFKKQGDILLKNDSDELFSLPNKPSKRPKNSADKYDRQDPGLGSNNWALSGKKTASGKTILCNDPHLTLNLPSIWFEIQLNAPGIHVYGASIPGAPGVLSGFNDSIAWGITNAAMDVRDWYSIQFRDNQRDAYLFDGTWIKTHKQIEKYVVRGADDFYDTLAYTMHGPVPYDKNFHKGPETVNKALRWTAHDAGNEMLTFYLLNKGRNYQDFQEALTYYYSPGQNFVFASASGDISMKQQGLFVNRDKNQGRFIQDGSKSETLWKGFIPADENPEVLNPPRGWVSSANQHPADTLWPHYYTGNYEYFRNRRINQQLQKLSHATIADMMKLQNDNFNLCASECLPILLSALSLPLDAEEKAIRADLERWNFLNDPDLICPVYFEIWWTEFRKLLWDEFEEKDKRMIPPGAFQTIRLIKTNRLGPFLQNASLQGKETLNTLCNISFRKIREATESWRKAHTGENLNWSNFKNTVILHLSQQKAFSVSNIFIGGNSGIVNAVTSRTGPSWKMVVSPGSENEAFGIYPGGQSGNPGSHFYSNFIDDWSRGKYYPLSMMRAEKKYPRLLSEQHIFPVIQ